MRGWIRKPDFEEWIALGMRLGYCTAPVCATHDGLPSTEDEDRTFEVGGDPCIAALRLLRGDEVLKDYHSGDFPS